MHKRNAVITASYAPDFERCAILCESMDRYATGYTNHYILVAEPDRALFARLEGAKRKVIVDTDILPWWLRRLPKAISPKRRNVWVGPLTMPLHGWHVQQLLRIGIAHMLDEDGLLYCDSDTAFIRPFHLDAMWDGDSMRLYREENGALTARSGHMKWAAHARWLFGIAGEQAVNHNYVCCFVTWKRQTVVDMCRHMERQTGKPWVAAIGASRAISECMIYGAYVDAVLGGAGHHIDNETLCPMQWFDPAPTEAELDAFVAGLGPHHAGMGIQSFIAMDAERFRMAARQAASVPA